MKIPKTLEWIPYANRDGYNERLKGRAGPCGHPRPCGCPQMATLTKCCELCPRSKCIFDVPERTPKTTKFGRG